MEQPASAPPPDGSFGALLRAFRHRACLSQEQLAARAGLSERTVRNIEAGRVRSPRNDTARLLADALALTEPERESWVAADQGANGRQAQAGLPVAGGPAQLPRRVPVAVLTGDAQDRSGPAISWLIGGAGQTVLVVHCAILGLARYPLARLTLPAAQRARSSPAARSGEQPSLPRRESRQDEEPALSDPQVLMEGITFGEQPRWHEGRPWFSDWGPPEVIAVDVEGNH
jgi:transcriptional regulator with XRE-family HTH domain